MIDILTHKRRSYKVNRRANRLLMSFRVRTRRRQLRTIVCLVHINERKPVWFGFWSSPSHSAVFHVLCQKECYVREKSCRRCEGDDEMLIEIQCRLGTNVQILVCARYKFNFSNLEVVSRLFARRVKSLNYIQAVMGRGKKYLQKRLNNYIYDLCCAMVFTCNSRQY